MAVISVPSIPTPSIPKSPLPSSKKIDKSTGKKTTTTKKKIKVPKISLMTYLGLGGVSLGSVALKDLPGILDKISSKVSSLPGGDIIATACDGAKTAIDGYNTAMDVFGGLMTGITIAKGIGEIGEAISNPASIGRIMAEVAGGLGGNAVGIAKDAIPGALSSITSVQVTQGSDGKPTIA